MDAKESVPAEPFDFTELLRPGLPPAATRWTGFPKYNFVGGHNDPTRIPIEGLIDLALKKGK